jgi:glycosyltransferase involved in cell wall biosynthesis
MSGPAKIYVLMSDMGIGGAERVMLALAEQFQRRTPVEFICLRQHGTLQAELRPGIPVCYLSQGDVSRSRMTVTGLHELIRLMRTEPSSILLATGTGTNLLACAARLFSPNGARLVIREACSSKNSSSAVLSFLKRLLYRHADGLIGVSDGVTEELKRLAGKNQPVISIPNPVDANRLHQLAELPDEALGRFPHQYILTVGRLVPQKNTALLINAFALIADETDAHLVVIGDGPLEAALLQLIARKGMQERIHLIGEVSNPHPWYKRASLFVLSSDTEGYPNVLLEALVQGLPILSTDCTFGPRQILDNGRYGGLIKVGNIEGMAEAIRSALKAGVVHNHWDATPFAVPTIADRYLAFMESCRHAER